MHTTARVQCRLPHESAGIGLKAAHVAEILARGAAVDFFEVHAENYLGAGGPFVHQLECVRSRWPLSIHGVGLSIGGADALDARHLARVAALVRRFEPAWFSEHLAWSSHGGACFNDLLPLPYHRASLERVCAHVEQVQHALGCRILLENPATYLEFAASTMDESGFIAEVVRRTGCGVLLDVNNAYVSAVNHGRDPLAKLGELLEAIDADAVREIHLAGFAEDRDAAGDRLLIDHHGAPVDDAVWALYERVIERIGPRPTLIERDNNIPALAVLESEAAGARAIQQRVRSAVRQRAPRAPAAPSRARAAATPEFA